MLASILAPASSCKLSPSINNLFMPTGQRLQVLQLTASLLSERCQPTDVVSSDGLARVLRLAGLGLCGNILAKLPFVWLDACPPVVIYAHTAVRHHEIWHLLMHLPQRSQRLPSSHSRCRRSMRIVKGSRHCWRKRAAAGDTELQVKDLRGGARDAQGSICAAAAPLAAWLALAEHAIEH
jgi:hypothetical protein